MLSGSVLFYARCQSINKNVSTACPGVCTHAGICKKIYNLVYMLHAFRFQLINDLALTATALHGNHAKKHIDVSWRPSNVPSDKRKRTWLLYLRSQYPFRLTKVY